MRSQRDTRGKKGNAASTIWPQFPFSHLRLWPLNLANGLRTFAGRLNGRCLYAPPTRNTKTVKNHSCRVRSIECIKVDAHPPDAYTIVLASLQSAQKLGREACATGQFRDAFESAYGGNRHDPGDNGNVNSGKRTTFAEIEEVAIIKKKLCDHVVGTGIHFRFEMIHFD